MSESLKDIKSMAIQMEMDGIRFYSDLAIRHSTLWERLCLSPLVEDEKLHAKRLQALLSNQNETVQVKG